MKKIFKVLASVLLGCVATTALLQGVTAIYDFPDPTPFVGKHIYNPYQGIDSAAFATDFKKSNYHAHQSMAFGNIDFPEYTYDEFMSAYKRAGYDIITISDHQYRHDGSMLPIYEHGYSFTNFHTQCYGASSVSWLDYPFMFLPSHQSQFFISTVSDLPLVGINHPSRLRMGVDESILATLRGYDVMEIDCVGAGPYDVALSSGNYVTITCNDDTHDFDSLGHRFQNRYNMTGCGADLSLPSVTKALRLGVNYAVMLTPRHSPRGAGTEPRLNKVDVKGDTIAIKLNSVVDSIVLIGQNGVVGATYKNTAAIKHKFGADDTYLRAVIYYPNSVFVTLNPFVRTEVAGTMPPPSDIASVNVWLTILNSICWLVVAFLITLIIRSIWRKTKNQRIHEIRDSYAPLRQA